ncbi:prephenate dehydrogenase/arogenate dehydrogenase family protein [Salinisphaera sp. SPP-AMP-43]|uniref:prephenate dehydrogenase n=1 Tax=Salinisphaera sp. SPP-AMP-43 TaxID=3121288 RepID=UPI003C6E2FD8
MANQATAVLPVDQVAIVGLGLIGGSIARGLRAAGYRGRLTGAVASAADAEHALALDLVDAAYDDIAAAVAEARLIVVAVPPGAMAGVLQEIAAAAPHDAVITDTGSSKASVIEAATAAFGGEAVSRFVPGHPIAGTENSGLQAGFATLFTQRRTILTPIAATDPAALATVEQLWRLLGAVVTSMSAAHHDEVLAATSHLPHVLAYALVDTLAGMAERTEIFEYAAGGFADFTRIASSDPTLWRDIVCANRAPLLAAVDAFIDHLQDVRVAIDAADATRLEAIFTRAKTARDDFVLTRENQGQ